MKEIKLALVLMTSTLFPFNILHSIFQEKCKNIILFLTLFINLFHNDNYLMMESLKKINLKINI